jgi:hypothetical protein
MALDFKQLCELVDVAYINSGNTLGYRFLYCPQECLSTNNGILLLGLNPGGHQKEKNILDVSKSLAYETEAWAGNAIGQSPLQKQVMLLLNSITEQANQTLASNIVFFRSRDWSRLKNKTTSIKSCMKIWRSIISNTPRLKSVLYIGKTTFDIARQYQMFEYYPTYEEKCHVWGTGS